jgi:hypothetical protein
MYTLTPEEKEAFLTLLFKRPTDEVVSALEGHIAKAGWHGFALGRAYERGHLHQTAEVLQYRRSAPRAQSSS